MEEGLDRVAQRRIATRKQAETFDSGAADDIAFVFAELPEDFSSEADVGRCTGGARDDEAKVPAGAGFGDGNFGENGGELGGVRNEKAGIAFGDAAGKVGGADALLGIVGRKCIYQLARDAAAIGLREEMLRLLSGDGETPAAWLHQIDFDTGASGRYRVHTC
jgi:hypothetical protein